MIDKTGGPAFPVLGGGFAKMLDGDAMVGMTLRDYFAAKALHGIMQADAWETDDGELIYSNESYAKEAYELADAMLAERDK